MVEYKRRVAERGVCKALTDVNRRLPKTGAAFASQQVPCRPHECSVGRRDRRLGIFRWEPWEAVKKKCDRIKTGFFLDFSTAGGQLNVPSRAEHPIRRDQTSGPDQENR